MANSRNRNYSLILYYPFDTIQNAISLRASNIRHYAYIQHDKDDKELHTHLLLNLYTDCTSKRIIDLLQSAFELMGLEHQNILCEPVHDKYGAFAYLTHENQKEKYQYFKEDIVTDSPTFWEQEVSESLQIIHDIIAGRDYLEMAEEYGRDFIINFHKYKDFAFMCKKN